MRTLSRIYWKRHWRRGLLAMLLGIAGAMSPLATAQQATATVNGTVKDPSGAAIPNAQVQLTNVNTGVVRKTVTTSVGIYNFPSVVRKANVFTTSHADDGAKPLLHPAVERGINSSEQLTVT